MKESNITNPFIPDRVRNINGWGIDADRKNDPTYPMKNYNGSDYQRLDYPRASQQPLSVEVLHSNERPQITRVFGTSSPPQGLSGRLRRYAFRFSEGSSGHWLTLILADRINAVEGIVDDLRQGHFPNILAERGWRAEWKYNRPSVIKKAAVGVAIVGAIVAIGLLTRRRKNAGI